MKTAVAYFRTSSASGVSSDKDDEKNYRDSLPRQQDAVRKYAEDNKIEIVNEYYDAAVSGVDPVTARPAFSEMVKYMLGNGARIILVENASRFARDLGVQLVGHDFLKKNGIDIIPVDAPNFFLESTPTAVMVRQILGSVAEFEKTISVERMRRGRERKKLKTGHCEGRRPVSGAHKEAAIKLWSPETSYNAVAREMGKLGMFVHAKGECTGRVYKAQSIKYMLKEKT